MNLLLVVDVRGVGAHRLLPHLLEIAAQLHDRRCVERKIMARAFPAVVNEPRTLQRPQVLRNRGAGDRDLPGDLPDGKRPASQLMKYRASRGIGKRCQTGLQGGAVGRI